MYQPLAPCTVCRRHVRASEPGCPFCGAAIGRAAASAPPPRLSRAGLAVFLAVAGCTEPTRETATPEPTVAKPVAEAGVEAPKPPPTSPVTKLDAGEVDNHGTMHAKYGGAPFPRPSPSVAVPAYGLPPPPPKPK